MPELTLQDKVLRAVREHPGLTAYDLWQVSAKNEHRPNTVSSTLKRLHTRGLVTREPNDLGCFTYRMAEERPVAVPMGGAEAIRHRRIVYKFLWVPWCLGSAWRWLRWVAIEEQLMYMDWEGEDRWDRWVPVRWVD